MTQRKNPIPTMTKAERMLSQTIAGSRRSAKRSDERQLTSSPRYASATARKQPACANRRGHELDHERRDVADEEHRPGRGV